MRGIPVGHLGAGGEAGQHGRRGDHQGLGTRGWVVGLRPVAQEQPEVGERVAQRRHLPVQDGGHPTGLGRVQDRVVQAVVAVHDRVALGDGHPGGQVGGQQVQPLVAGDPGRLPLRGPPPDLALEVALGPAELPEAHRGRVDAVQLGQHVDQSLAHEAALRRLVGVPGRERLAADVALDQLHDVERRAEHLGVGAQVQGAWHRDRRARQGCHHGVLAHHVVRGRQDVAQRRSSQHDRPVGTVDPVGQVALATGDERDRAVLPRRVGEDRGEVRADHGRVGAGSGGRHGRSP